MKKLVLSILAICFLLAGCSTASDKKTANSDGDGAAPVAEVAVKDGLNTPFTADGIEMKLTEVSSSESVDQADKPKQLITFTVENKNIGTEDKGIGAIDFRLVTDKKDKTYPVTEEMEAFGGVLKPDESAKGKLYYLIEPDEKPTKLEYAPADKALKTWDLQ
ncbi:DUF4352 domain-containing protein [Enterococcus sp. AZ072]|uniref:DUF4352 domain-containing protein n=1 Tax=unclassified Enterococcus TaxID=2608891 RepID=UPI003D2D72D5